jgi:hypothetical protein
MQEKKKEKLINFMKKIEYLRIEGYRGLELLRALIPDIKNVIRSHEFDIQKMSVYFGVSENEVKKIFREIKADSVKTEGIIWGEINAVDG